MRRHYSLILVAFWLLIGFSLVFPGQILPAFRAPGGELVGVMAFVFAAYNLVRWWAYQSLYRTQNAARTINPLTVRKLEQDSEEYERHPEFDFLKLPGVETPHPPPEPSANGDHKG